MGDDKGWIGAAVVSAPAALLVWVLQARMIFRGLTPDGAAAALFSLALTNLVWLPTAIFGFEDVNNLFFRGGALCGPDYADLQNLSDWRYWITRSLVAVYFALGPLLTLALSVALVVKNMPVKEH